MPKKNITLFRSGCIAMLLLLCISGLYAQKTVSGTVTGSKDHQPVAGATVQVKGTTDLTQTGADGSFSIKLPKNKGILVITVIGFEKMEIPVSAGTPIGPISMVAIATDLNDIIVTGYSSQRRKDITGSVAVVNVENMKSVPSGSTESLLQGQAAGVTVTNTGQPGGASTVRIRGITSVGSSDPLVIIDGTPGSLHDVNPDDIQSLQVLKDAGAASIYGVRGSNGVIIVTTKRGRSGKIQLAYDGYYGTQRPLKKGFGIANPTLSGQALWQEYENDGLTPSDVQYGSGPTPVVPDYITPSGAMTGDPRVNPSNYALYTNQITQADKAGNDWFHDIFKAAPTMSHNISASGGTDKSTFFFSFNYLDQEGTLIYTKLQRYSARINSTFSLLNDHVRIGENANVIYKSNPGYLNLPGINNQNAIGAAYAVPSIIPVFDIRGNYAGTGSQGLGNSPQPFAMQARTANNTNSDWQMNGNLFAEVDFLKHFTAHTSIGGTVDNFYNNAFVYTAYENAENSQAPNSYYENYGWNSSMTWTNTLKYANTFGDKHHLTVLGGSEYINNAGRAVGVTRGNYYITDSSNLTVDPNLWTLNFGSPSGQTNSNIASDNGMLTPYQMSIFSLFGRVDYNFADKYLLSATVRRDGSSVFSASQRYGVFPSVTAGWRISNESFMKSITWLNDLKIRGGWGKMGSISNVIPTNAYTLYGQAVNQSYYDINGTSNNPAAGLYTAQYGNQNTTWEKDILTNVGFDATIIRSKIDLTFEWYKKLISGLLFQPGFTGTNGGAADPYTNIGDISNDGIDMALTYHGAIRHDLRFDITGTFTSYNNKVVSLPPGLQYLNISEPGNTTVYSRLQPGHPVGEFFGYKVAGLFQDAADVAKSPTQDAAAPGRFKYADVNHDGKIDDNDRTFFGNPNPKFTTGLNIGLNYKQFDFFIFMYASVGSKILNLVKSSTDFPQAFGNAMSTDVALNSAKLVNASGDPTNILDPAARVANPGATIPVLERQANFSNTTAFNSFPLENGNYLRCKTMTLGYNLLSNKFKQAHIDRFRVYVQAVNLFTFTKYSGLDPELNPGTNELFGIDGGPYPNNQKTFNVGVNLSFH
jgi:TonB-linked SusC/RagA family outer membrane protein